MFDFFDFFKTFQKCLINMLSTSHQRLSNLVPNSNYAYFCILGPKCPNMVIWPQTPIFYFFWKMLNVQKCLINTLPTSPRQLSKLVPNSNYAYFRLLGPKWPNMVIWPPDCQIFDFFEFFRIFRNVLLIRFQRVLNDFPILFQTRMNYAYLLVLGPQMPKYGNLAPDPQFFLLENF